MRSTGDARSPRAQESPLSSRGIARADKTSSLLRAIGAKAFLAASIGVLLVGPARSDERMPSEFMPDVGRTHQFSRQSARIAPRHPRDAVLAIALPEPAEIQEKKAAAAKRIGPAEIGFGRTLPTAYEGDLDYLLTWAARADGGYIAVLEISSPRAQGMRAGIRALANGNVTFRFFGTQDTGGALPVFTPKSASALEDTDLYWSPTVEGELLGIEIYAQDWDAAASLELEIGRISHIFSLTSASSVSQGVCESAPAACGRASSCAQGATVRLSYVADDGMSYTCSGTVINDDREPSEKANNAFVYTAYHCISSQSVAESLEMQFHYADTSCTDTTLDSRHSRYYGGADLLEASLPEHDQSLVRLRKPINAEGVCFVGWDANRPAVNTAIVGVHHPDGGRKEWLAGQISAFESGPIMGGGTVEGARVELSEGRTEGGSSGSGLFSDNGGTQHLLGSLFGRDENNCAAKMYGVFSDFYPQVRSHLRGEDTPPPGADDHGDTWSVATAIAANSNTAGRLDPAYDIDYFTFTVDEDGDVTIESIGSVDTHGALYDSDGRELLRDDDGGDRYNFRLSMRLSAGTYYVSVGGYDRTVGDYELSVQYETDFPYAREVPLMVSADAIGRQGFLRIQNVSRDATSSLEITGVDVDGRVYGPVRYRLGSWQSAHFNSADIEKGNSAKGLDEGLGDGVGWWRLQIKASAQVFATSYVRTPDGFLTSIHDSAPAYSGEEEFAFLAPIFNPASNTDQRSYLWITNLSRQTNNITVRGVDDAGYLADGPVRFAIDGGVSVSVGSEELESGIPGIDSGAFGDGEGKWRLSVEAPHPIRVLALMATPQGHITNLSTLNALRPAADDQAETLRELSDLEILRDAFKRDQHGSAGHFPLLSPAALDRF